MHFPLLRVQEDSLPVLELDLEVRNKSFHADVSVSQAFV